MPDSLSPGDEVERYRVELQLGRGGMATVFRVRHTTLGTLHALKVLRTHDPTIRKRLILEGQVQARIRHDNVVNVTDVLDIDGAPALLMDFVGGGSMAELLALGRLPRDQALVLFSGILAGVQHAHANGLVHRDLKPANVLIAARPDGSLVPKVTDFGLARITDDSRSAAAMTREGQTMGTPAYMAPEQVRDASKVDKRADLWSLGVMLYELVCGQRPFAAPDVMSLMYRVVQGAYQPAEDLIADLPPPVSLAIRGALVRDRAQRIPDCETMAAVLAGEATWAAPAPPVFEAVDEAPGPGPETASHTWDPLAEATPGAAPQRPGLLPEPPGPASAEASHTFAFGLEDGPAASPETAVPEPAAPAPPAPTAPSPTAPSPTAPSPTAPLPTALSPTAQPSTATPSTQRSSTKDLGPPSPGPDAVSRSITALVTDHRGTGHVVELIVTLLPGRSGVWAPDGVGRDATVAAQLAYAVALGADADAHGLRWSVRGSSAQLTGTSIGLAVGLAARAAWRGVQLPAGVAMTGGVDLDGRVARVGGVPAKARAAAKAGLSRVLAPEADVAQIGDLDDIELVGVSTFDEAARLVLPASRRRRLGRLATLPVVAAVVLLGALALPEAWLHHKLLGAVRGPLALDNTAILGIDVPEARTLRPQHAQTLRALADAGAEVVLIDLAFGSAMPGVDEELAAAIDELAARNVTVVRAVRFSSNDPVLPATAALAQAGRMGSVETASAGPLGHVVGPRVRRRGQDGQVLWHTAVVAAAAAVGADSPHLDGDLLSVGPLQVVAEREVMTLPPFDANPLVVPYGQLDRYGELDGRVVVIGAWDIPRDHHPTPDGPRYGVELQAAAVETILRQAAPRRVSNAVDALVSLATGGGVIGLGLLLPRRRVGLALLVPASLLAVAVALSTAGVLVGLLALIAGATAGWWALRGLAR